MPSSWSVAKDGDDDPRDVARKRYEARLAVRAGVPVTLFIRMRIASPQERA